HPPSGRVLWHRTGPAVRRAGLARGRADGAGRTRARALGLHRPRRSRWCRDGGAAVPGAAIPAPPRALDAADARALLLPDGVRHRRASGRLRDADTRRLRLFFGAVAAYATARRSLSTRRRRGVLGERARLFPVRARLPVGPHGLLRAAGPRT